MVQAHPEAPIQASIRPIRADARLLFLPPLPSARHFSENDDRLSECQIRPCKIRSSAGTYEKRRKDAALAGRGHDNPSPIPHFRCTHAQPSRYTVPHNSGQYVNITDILTTYCFSIPVGKSPPSRRKTRVKGTLHPSEQPRFRTVHRTVVPVMRIKNIRTPHYKKNSCP